MAFCCSCALFWAFLGLVAYVLYSIYKKVDHKPRKEGWKKDTVYLYQFHRPAGLASLSPFCVKLEMFLRMHNIDYENVFISSSRSKYGLVPFIELNGEHIADSQLILERLKSHFKVKGLSTPRDEGIARGLDRLADNHSFLVLIKYKVLDDLDGFVTTVMKSLNVSAFLIPIALPLLKIVFRKKVGNRVFTGLGRYSDAEFHSLLKKDLDAYRDVLGERQFLMGDEPTSVDCTVFGQLVTVCWLKESNEVKRLVASEYPTLQAYQERCIARFFPSEFK